MSITYNPTTSSGSPVRTSHIQQGWHAGRRIVVYELSDISQTIMNEWTALAVDLIQSWDTNRPYLALHDISHPGIAMKYGWVHADLLNPAITQHGRARLFATPQEEEQFHGRIALLISLRCSGNFARLVATKDRQQRLMKHVEHKVFTEKRAALLWLEAALDTKPQ